MNCLAATDKLIRSQPIIPARIQKNLHPITDKQHRDFSKAPCTHIEELLSQILQENLLKVKAE
jgi:hypothetical protein